MVLMWYITSIECTRRHRSSKQDNPLVNNVATMRLVLTLTSLGVMLMAIQQSEIKKFYVKAKTQSHFRGEFSTT